MCNSLKRDCLDDPLCCVEAIITKPIFSKEHVGAQQEVLLIGRWSCRNTLGDILFIVSDACQSIASKERDLIVGELVHTVLAGNLVEVAIKSF